MVTPSYTRTAPAGALSFCSQGTASYRGAQRNKCPWGTTPPPSRCARLLALHRRGGRLCPPPYKLLKLCTSPPHSHVSTKSTHRLLNKRIIAMMTATERIEKTGSKNVVVIYISQLTVISLSLPVTVPLSQHVADIMPRYASSLNVSFP